MIFDVNVDQSEWPAILAQSLQIITPKLLNDRQNEFERGVRENPVIEHYIDSHFAIERAIHTIREYKRATGRVHNLVNETDLKLHRAFAFMAMLARVHARMTPAEQNALSGRIRQGMTSPDGLASLAYELHTVSHLMLNGFDVAWNDLSSGQHRFDFLARKEELEIEVECKTFSTDLGRKIHLNKQFRLAGRIHASLADAVQHNGSFFLHINLPNRLNGAHIDKIAAVARASLSDFMNVAEADLCSITPYCLEIQGSPFENISQLRELDQAVVHSYIQRTFGINTRRYMFFVRPDLGVAVVGLTSEQPDDVADSIYRQLKEGAEQLSRTRPGFVCASFLDMSPYHLEELAQSQSRTAFHTIMDDFYSNPSRAHVHTVEFTTLGVVDHRSYQLPATQHEVTAINTPSYRFTNNGHPLANDRRLRI